MSVETQQVAEGLAKSLHGGMAVVLFGDLGSGKTTFTQGLARGLGISGQVTSPSFLVMRLHTVRTNSTIKRFFHIDLYRTESEQDILAIGITDAFSDPKGVAVIEWGEKLESLLPKKRIEVRLEYVDENKRKIHIRHYGQ
jgi:tRNA threonylcarbamoyladenosine biosynthesis protein TsaE